MFDASKTGRFNGSTSWRFDKECDQIKISKKYFDKEKGKYKMNHTENSMVWGRGISNSAFSYFLLSKKHKLMSRIIVLSLDYKTPSLFVSDRL